MKQNPYFGNILLIAGAGRNVGKTAFACMIIEYLSLKHEVIGLKISPHRHDPDVCSEILFQNENVFISREKGVSEKDSSKMLQAGAKQVYYIQAEQSYLEAAFLKLKPLINQKPVVCESGGLHKIVRPGIFFFIHREGKIPEEKKAYSESKPLMIDLFSEMSTFDLTMIRFEKGNFSIDT